MSKLDEQKSHYTNLYIKNLDLEVSQERFEEMFRAFGAITSAVVQVLYLSTAFPVCLPPAGRRGRQEQGLWVCQL